MENTCPYCQEGDRHRFLNQRIADVAERETGYLSDFILLALDSHGCFSAIALDEEGNSTDQSTVFMNFCPMCGRSFKYEDGFYEASSRWGVCHSIRR